MFWSVERGEPLALCGQGVAPAAATIERFHELGHELIPGTGVLAACVPGAFGGWLLLLAGLRHVASRRRSRVRHRLRRARLPAPRAHPRDDRAERGARRELARLTRPLPAGAGGGRALPQPCARGHVSPHRRGESRRVARGRDREGAACLVRGLRRGGDRPFRRGRRRLPRPAPTWPPGTRRSSRSSALEYRGLTVCKTQPWAAGPVGLQQLALLRGYDLAELSAAEFVHVVVECGKLAFADRDALYGDSAEVPLETLLSREYNDERRSRIGDEASGDYVPGSAASRACAPQRRRSGRVSPAAAPSTSTSPIASATCSRRRRAAGGCRARRSSPHSAGRWGPARRCSGSRRGSPSSLEPGKRPRTTLCPGLALRDGEPYLAWGTPGGDQQEQWALHAFVRHVDLGLDLQAAIDAPEFHTDHLISSFFPRGFAPKSLAVESRFDARTIADLQRRGHDVSRLAGVVRGTRLRGRTRAGRPPPSGGEPARDAGLRGGR